MATQRQVAEHLDLTDRQIRNLIGRHVLPPSARGRGLDLDLCRSRYIQYLRSRADSRAVGAGDYEIEKTRLTKAQADKTELEVQELRGSLIRMTAVAEHWQSKIYAARAKLLALAPRLAVCVAAPDKIAEAQDAAQALIFEALAELAGDGIPLEVKNRIDALERSRVSGVDEVAAAPGDAATDLQLGRETQPPSSTTKLSDSSITPDAKAANRRTRQHAGTKTTRKRTP